MKSVLSDKSLMPSTGHEAIIPSTIEITSLIYFITALNTKKIDLRNKLSKQRNKDIYSI